MDRCDVVYCYKATKFNDFRTSVPAPQPELGFIYRFTPHRSSSMKRKEKKKTQNPTSKKQKKNGETHRNKRSHGTPTPRHATDKRSQEAGGTQPRTHRGGARTGRPSRRLSGGPPPPGGPPHEAYAIPAFPPPRGSLAVPDSPTPLDMWAPRVIGIARCVTCARSRASGSGCCAAWLALLRFGPSGYPHICDMASPS